MRGIGTSRAANTRSGIARPSSSRSAGGRSSRGTSAGAAPGRFAGGSPVRRCPDRCASTNGSTVRTCTSVTRSSPSSAASARLARTTARSARNERAPCSQTVRLMKSRSSGDGSSAPTLARAACSRAASPACSLSHVATNAPGSRSKARRRSTIRRRSAGSIGTSTSAVSAKRSSSCGLSAPSSGFIVPTSTKSAGCAIAKPSRSTMCVPLATASSSASAR